MVAPSPVGGHNWYPMSYSPLTGLVYVPTREGSSLYTHDPKFEMRDRGWNIGIGQSSQKPNPKSVEAAGRTPRGAALLAWDPVTQREVWRVNYTRAGNGGTLATAGNLVFQGSSDGMFNAYDAATGKSVWPQQVQNAVIAGPITYELDGEQYVAAMAGIGGVAMGGAMGGDRSQRSEFGRLVVFKLGGKAQLPALESKVVRVLPNLSRADAIGDPLIGKAKYDTLCSVCHGAAAVSTTAVPDLRYARAIVDAAQFKSIVLDGILTEKGMVSFASVLNPQEAEGFGPGWYSKRAC